MSSPTARTLDRLRQMGYTAEVVERWLPKVGLRRDLFHFADVVAIHRTEPGVLLIQCTTRDNLSSRMEKTRKRPEARTCLEAKNRIELWGWHESRYGHWDVVRCSLQLHQLETDTRLLLPKRRSKPRRYESSLFA